MVKAHVGRTAVLTLSFAAGLSDAFAFLALGGVFTANMTGNVVLSALFSHHGYGRVVAGALGSIAAFALGAYVTFRGWTRRTDAGRGDHLRSALLPAVLLELVVAGLWTAVHTDVVRVLVIMGSACVMGMQSAVMKRSTHGGVVTTTYVTGTIVGLMEDLAAGRPGLRRRLASIAMLVLGALAGCALTAVDDRLAPWGCALTLAVAWAVSSRPVPAGEGNRGHAGLTARQRPIPPT